MKTTTRAALLLLALLAPSAAEASLERAGAPRLAPSFERTPDVSASQPAAPRFDLFAGDELARAAAEPGSAESFHPLAAVSLLSEDASLDLAPRSDVSYPKTRVWVFDVFSQRVVGVSRGLSVELDWGSASFSCGLASDEREDPLGLQTPGEELDPSVDVVQKAIVKAAQTTQKILANPRVQGGFKLFAAAAEGTAGAFAAATPTGVGQVVGFGAVVHASDVGAAGLRQLITGQEVRTFTSQGLEAGAKGLGFSPGAARAIGEGGDVLASAAFTAGSTSIARGLIAPAARAAPVLRSVPTTPAVQANTWQEYETAVRNQYGAAAFRQRQYQAVVEGRVVNGVADVIPNANVAVEAKFVGREGWSNSIRNPSSAIGDKPFAVNAQTEVLEQAQRYSAAFDRVIYHSNDLSFIRYYSSVFGQAGLENVEFVYTPSLLH